MKQDQKQATLAMMVVLSIVALVVATFLMRGAALSVGWGWLVVPVFPDAPRITVLQAIGLSALIGFVARPGGVGGHPIDADGRDVQGEDSWAAINRLLRVAVYEPVMFTLVAFVLMCLAK